MAGTEIGRLLALLREALALGGDDQQDFLDAHPELYAVQHFPAIRHTVSSAPDGDAIEALLGRLAGHVEACERNQEPFAVGSGPFEQLWLKVTNGVIGQREAERAAADFALAAQADIYLRVLTTLGRRLREAVAWQLLGIVRSGAAARPGGSLSSGAGRDLELEYVRAAAKYLVDEADGRLARSALAAGEELLAKARAIADRDLESSALLVLGTLHSDPYAVRKVSGKLEAELGKWQQTFWEKHWQELRDLRPEEWLMPPAEQSLVKGADYFMNAARLMSGTDRGRALSKAFQSLRVAQTLGATVDVAELRSIGQEAAVLIDPDQSPGELLVVLGNLNAMGESVDRAVIDRLLEPSLDSRLRESGAEVALEIALSAVPLLRGIDAARAEAAATRARPLVEFAGKSHERPRQWMNEIRAAVDNRVPGGYAAFPDLGTEDAAVTIRARARQGGWDPQAVAVALVGLAELSTRRDEELLGLQLVSEAEEAAPVWSLDHRKALQFLRTELHTGVAVNAVNRSDWPEAIKHYVTALDNCCDLDLPEIALDLLARVDDLVSRSGYDGAVRAVFGIAKVAVLLENLWGDAATEYLQQVCRSALPIIAAGAPPHGADPQALMAVMQVAKGLRFAALLLSNSRFRWHEDDQGKRLLTDIAEAESTLSQQSVTHELEQPIHDDLLLAASLTSTGDNPDSATSELRALRQAYDRHVYSTLLTRSVVQEPVLLRWDSMIRAIDVNTVLIDLFAGISPDGNLATYIVALTREGIRVAIADTGLAEREVQLNHETRSARVPVMTLLVSDLRRELQEPSEPDDVSDETRAQLAGFLSDVLAGLPDWLDSWRDEGMTHLCFVPHGALHYLPFHLLHNHGEPLAATWTVTTLPNHALLLDERGGATITRRDRELTAFGLTYPTGNVHGLPLLTHAAAEATAVADVFGEAPVLDTGASKQRVLSALTGSRYVHIAAHGRHDYEAPSFQCIYLAPDEDSDGRLRAHELLSLDLRGTELVTLSACESSLGRVDLADNLLGLPAALLLAGVRAVVGTLWHVRSDTAQFFFTALYERVRMGLPSRLAFTEAQRHTRARYPVYRDWGAFCFIGQGR
jgi:CHAT domain-containing protein